MSTSTLLGFVALTLGAVLLFFAVRATTAPVDQLSQALTGRYTSDTMWFLFFGMIGAVGGAALILRGGRRHAVSYKSKSDL